MESYFYVGWDFNARIFIKYTYYNDFSEFVN